MSRAVRRNASGRYDVRLDPAEREMLSELRLRMEEVYADPADPALKRLLPVAYPDDEDRETEYRLLVHDELMNSQREALDTLATTVDERELSEEQLAAWIRAITQVRLAMASRLGVTGEDEDRPPVGDRSTLATYAIYEYLAELQDDIVNTLSEALPEVQDEPGDS